MCNRPPGSATSIPARSEDTDIPGNRDLPPEEVAARQERFFRPFHAAVAACLDARAGRPTIVIGVHSFTPVYQAVRRPWHAGLLYAAAAPLGRFLVEALAAEPGLVVGDNEPYRMDLIDYTIPRHAYPARRFYAEIEIRQDLIGAPDGCAAWAERVASALTSASARVRSA